MAKLLDQEKLALASVEMAAEFVADFAAGLGGQRGKGLGRSGKAIGKAVFAAHENHDGNQPEDFFIARLALREIGGKTVRLAARTFYQDSCLPDEIVPDLLSSHNL